MFPKVTPVILSIFLVACNDKDELTQIDCSLTICTEVFVTITVSVKNASGEAIRFDSYEVIDVDSGKNLTDNFNEEENQYLKEQGLYPILSDTYRVKYQNSTATVTFKGYNSNEEVINEEFVVSADCCHVSLISGNTEIILD